MLIVLFVTRNNISFLPFKRKHTSKKSFLKNHLWVYANRLSTYLQDANNYVPRFARINILNAFSNIFCSRWESVNNIINITRKKFRSVFRKEKIENFVFFFKFSYCRTFVKQWGCNRFLVYYSRTLLIKTSTPFNFFEYFLTYLLFFDNIFL